jgi:group I intron endonuclease
LTKKRPNSLIHRALILHGYSNFSLKILEYCDIQDTFTREQYYLDLLNPTYNIQKVAGAYAGYKHPDEIRRAMSESRKGENNPLLWVYKNSLGGEWQSQNLYQAVLYISKTKTELGFIG